MNDDVHAPYVAELAAAEDWAGLLRHWIAHGLHEPALAAAIMIVRSRAGEPWATLATYLAAVAAEPMEPREVPEHLREHDWDQTVAVSLQFVAMFPWLALCKYAAQAPLDRQEQLLNLGIQSAKQGHQLAALIEDVELGAFCHGLLARAYQEGADLEAAEASHQETLAAYRELAQSRPDVYRPLVAMTLNNLGIVQRGLNRLEDAEASYQEALAAYRELARSRPDVYRPDVAMTLNNLGIVQRGLNRLEDAEASYQEALAAYRELARSRPDVYRPLVAATLNNLGNVRRDLNRLEAAEASYNEADNLYEALRQQLGTSQLAERLRLYRNYANLLLQDESDRGWPDRPEARGLLAKAAACAEVFRGQFHDPRERIRMQQEYLGVFAQQVRVNLEVGELYNDPSAYQEALEAAEASRSRALLDSLVPVFAPAAAPLELKEEFTRLRRELRTAQRRAHHEYVTLQRLAELEDRPAADGPPAEPDEPVRGTAVEAAVRRLRSPVELTRDLDGIQKHQDRLAHVMGYVAERVPKYQAVCERLKQLDKTFDPDAAVSSFRWVDRAVLFPAGCRTVYIVLEEQHPHCAALVVTADAVHAVKLGSITTKELYREITRLAAAQEIRSTSDMIAGVKAAVRDALAVLRTHVWEPLQPTLRRIGLRPDDRLTFVPDGALNFLPLHAIPTDEGTIADRYEVGYSPSLSVLFQCVRRTPPPPTDLFVAVDPLEDPNLVCTTVEAALVRREFPAVTERIGRQLTKEIFLREAARSHVCLWTGHAVFSVEVPYWSGLVVGRSGDPRRVRAPGDVITFTDIDCGLRMPACSLAVLCGCQSGLALAGAGNEYVSLIGAFLNAGAKCVLASLWPVEDKACMLTVDRFFREWQGGTVGAAVALKTAQQWLRGLTIRELKEYVDRLPGRGVGEDEVGWLRRFANDHPDDHRPYADPYYWAAFVAVGQTWAA